MPGFLAGLSEKGRPLSIAEGLSAVVYRRTSRKLCQPHRALLAEAYAAKGVKARFAGYAAKEGGVAKYLFCNTQFRRNLTQYLPLLPAKAVLTPYGVKMLVLTAPTRHICRLSHIVRQSPLCVAPYSCGICGQGGGFPPLPVRFTARRRRIPLIGPEGCD